MYFYSIERHRISLALLSTVLFILPIVSYAKDSINSLPETKYFEFVPWYYYKDWQNANILYEFYYEGSDIPPAEMFFFSNGVLIIRSRFYSEGFATVQSRFFLYKFNEDGDEVTIKPTDKRYDLVRFVDTAKYHIEKGRTGIISVDQIDGVVLRFGDKINFLGLYFFLK